MCGLWQDELIQAAQKKGVKQQAIEKKIAVLEKALEIHGDSEDLTLLYLQACSLRDTVAEMQNKWQNSIAHFSGSYRFWKAFLVFWCSQFSLFSVSSIRSVYVQALRALTGVRDRVLHGVGTSLFLLMKDVTLHSYQLSVTGFAL